jgi:hypothetical protein
LREAVVFSVAPCLMNILLLPTEVSNVDEWGNGYDPTVARQTGRRPGEEHARSLRGRRLTALGVGMRRRDHAREDGG